MFSVKVQIETRIMHVLLVAGNWKLFKLTFGGDYKKEVFNNALLAFNPTKAAAGNEKYIDGPMFWVYPPRQT